MIQPATKGRVARSNERSRIWLLMLMLGLRSPKRMAGCPPEVSITSAPTTEPLDAKSAPPPSPERWRSDSANWKRAWDSRPGKRIDGPCSTTKANCNVLDFRGANERCSKCSPGGRRRRDRRRYRMQDRDLAEPGLGADVPGLEGGVPGVSAFFGTSVSGQADRTAKPAWTREHVECGQAHTIRPVSSAGESMSAERRFRAGDGARKGCE